MPGSHDVIVLGSPEEIELRKFWRRKQGQPPGDLASFEQELHRYILAFEGALLAAELARHDVDAERIEIQGQLYRRGRMARETYATAAGPIQVMRRLYHRVDGAKGTVVPLELQAGIIAGHWTPWAAEQMAFAVTMLTPADAATLLAKLGHVAPSKSSLDRLPKTLSARWEVHSEAFAAAIRAAEPVPTAAVVAVSIDGLLTPMKSSKGRPKRMTSSKRPCGPAGFREVGVATVALYDTQRKRLRTKYWSRMPEAKKVTLHRLLAGEVADTLTALPGAKVVALADGARENWRILRAVAPGAIEIVDFFHAVEHLHKGFNAYYGEGSYEARLCGKHYRRALRDETDGAQQVLRALQYRAKQSQGHKAKLIQAEVTFFRNHLARMGYAAYRAQGLPIGSGVVEAGCKIVVTQRMKQSGMRWSLPGGQAILTLRSLRLSDRWDAGWSLLKGTYVHPVTILRTGGIADSTRVAS
jgi:hypothetical protein